MTIASWPWWHQQTGPHEYRIRELLRAIWDLHAMYGQTTWLWRGQPNAAHNIVPGVHSRIVPSERLDDAQVLACTQDLIDAAKRAALDVHEGVRLPDLALLAMLQHHGAATPLLDVSLDPLVALYMAVVSSNAEDDLHDGALFAFRRPKTIIPAFESSSFAKTYAALPADQVVFYSAPDVSERLRIQRGHFLTGRVAAGFRTTLPLGIEDPSEGLANIWVYRLMNRRGEVRRQPRLDQGTDVAVFRVTGNFKTRLRAWLEDRSGLTPAFVLPTAWHRPHLDAFCQSHGRKTPWPAAV